MKKENINKLFLVFVAVLVVIYFYSEYESNKKEQLYEAVYEACLDTHYPNREQAEREKAKKYVEVFENGSDEEIQQLKNKMVQNALTSSPLEEYCSKIASETESNF